MTTPHYLGLFQPPLTSIFLTYGAFTVTLDRARPTTNPVWTRMADHWAEQSNRRVAQFLLHQTSTWPNQCTRMSTNSVWRKTVLGPSRISSGESNFSGKWNRLASLLSTEFGFCLVFRLCGRVLDWVYIVCVYTFTVNLLIIKMLVSVNKVIIWKMNHVRGSHWDWRI